MATEKKKAGGKKPAAAKKKNGAADADKDAAGKQARRQNAAAGMGHNLTAVREQARGFAARYNNLLDEKEKLSGEIMVDVKALLEEGANAIGCSRKVLRMALHNQRAEMKLQAKIAELEANERSDLETLEDALGDFKDLPLGQAAVKAEKTQEPAFAEGP